MVDSLDKTRERHEALQDELYQSNDRSMLIVGVTLIEDSLRSMVLAHLGPHAKSSGDDPLFGRSRPLSTFSALIDVAHRLRLMDVNLHFVLHRLRLLRNECAHSSKLVALDSSPYSDHIAQLRSRLDMSVSQDVEPRTYLILLISNLMSQLGSGSANVELNEKPVLVYLWVSGGSLKTAVAGQEHHPTHWAHFDSDVH